MDNLTHSLVGAVIGQAGLKRKTGLAMPALIIGANLPDVDAACFLWLDGVEHLGFRRGITHGPIAWVLLPLLLAGALWWWDRWQTKRGKRPEGRLPVHFGWLYALSLIGCLTHPALDWLNVYGIRLLEPFSSRWFYGDVLFIIDVWLWAILGIGLWLSLRRERRGKPWRTPAVIGLMMGLVYLWCNDALTNLSERTANSFAPDAQIIISSPLPLWSWRREQIIQAEDGSWQSTLGDGSRASYPFYQISVQPCRWPDLSLARKTNDELDAFLFWSRAPFAERAPDGSVLLRDARYYDPRARDRFTVALPDVECEGPVSR